MITQHELWEKLIFSSSGGMHGHNLATKVLDRLPDAAERRETQNTVSQARDVITFILLNEAERIVRRTFTSHGEYNSSLEQFLENRLSDMLAYVPVSLLEETEELVYNELDNPEELPVAWSEEAQKAS